MQRIKAYFRTWREKLKNEFQRMIAEKDAPHRMATGFAIGVFFAVAPTFGAALVLAFLAARFLRANLIAAGLGVLAVNPLTAPLVIAASFSIGMFLLQLSVSLPDDFSGFFTLFRAPAKIVLIYMVGNLALSLFSAAAAYAAMFWGMYWWQHRKR